jgi:hypothetical protein
VESNTPLCVYSLRIRTIQAPTTRCASRKRDLPFDLCIVRLFHGPAQLTVVSADVRPSPHQTSTYNIQLTTSLVRILFKNHGEGKLARASLAANARPKCCLDSRKSALYLKSICGVGEKHDHMHFHFSCWKICADVVFFSNIK